jgi:hypothetical protein
MPSLEDRAERLRVLIELAHYLPLTPSEAIQHLPPEDLRHIVELEDGDLELANACLAVEAEVRAENFGRLALLGQLVHTAPGTGAGQGLDERLAALPIGDFAAAARALLGLGWVSS